MTTKEPRKPLTVRNGTVRIAIFVTAAFSFLAVWMAWLAGKGATARTEYFSARFDTVLTASRQVSELYVQIPIIRAQVDTLERRVGRIEDKIGQHVGP